MTQVRVKDASSFVLRQRPSGYGFELLVDGVDIAAHVSELKITADSRDVTKVNVELHLFFQKAELDLPEAIIKALPVAMDSTTNNPENPQSTDT